MRASRHRLICIYFNGLRTSSARALKQSTVAISSAFLSRFIVNRLPLYTVGSATLLFGQHEWGRPLATRQRNLQLRNWSRSRALSSGILFGVNLPVHTAHFGEFEAFKSARRAALKIVTQHSRKVVADVNSRVAIKVVR